MEAGLASLARQPGKRDEFVLMGRRWLTWVQFPLGTTYDSYVKIVSQRSAESRGFSPGTPVSSHREC